MLVTESDPKSDQTFLTGEPLLAVGEVPKTGGRHFASVGPCAFAGSIIQTRLKITSIPMNNS